MNITTQNRIARQLDGLTQDNEGLSMLQHFDYPETWSYTGIIPSSAAKFGKNCIYFSNTDSRATVTNTTGMFNLSPLGNYEAECFVKFLEMNSEDEYNILSFGDLALTLLDSTLRLSSSTFSIDSSKQIVADTSGYSFYGGHTFKLFTEAKTWADAKAACEALGGHLTTSTSAEKNEFLNNLASGSRVWLGATDEASDGTWQWVSGEEWSYTNWESDEPQSSKTNEDYVVMVDSKWRDTLDTDSFAYICEWDNDIRDGYPYNSETWLNAWHHILLRVTGGYAYIFVDGSEALKAYISSQAAITPEQVELGGYIGHMDEFAFRRNAGTGAPTVPTEAYEMSAPTKIPTKDAPVTRVAWSAEGLPEGITLSESGQLTGHPTTAGSYDATITVTTNWGTTTKTVRITVNE